MSKAYDFIKECGYFYVLTINGDFPAGRPFGTIYEYGEKLFICTGDSNSVHTQLRTNGNIQILAKKEGTREWLRITGKAAECTDAAMKRKVFEECPGVRTHVSDPEDPHYLVFAVEVLDIQFH